MALLLRTADSGRSPLGEHTLAPHVRSVHGRTSLIVGVAFALTMVACENGSSDTTTGTAKSDPATTTEVIDTGAITDMGDSPMDWALAGSLSGAIRQIVPWSDGFAALHFPEGDDWTSDVADPELWFSGDGIDWEAARVPPIFEPVVTLAGHDGDLFALTGDTSDRTTPQTLWHRTSGSPWEQVLSHVLLERIAIGADRVIAYQQYPFGVLAVYDAATLQQVDFNGLPELERPEQVPGPAEIRELPGGGVTGLDDGFLARVGWADTSFSDGDRVAWLLYSADGSTWTEHPADSTADFRTVCTSPTFEGLNLLTTDRQAGTTAANRLLVDRWNLPPSDTELTGPTSSWVTDTGVDLQPTAPATIESASATTRGFFSVTAGAIRHSLDGMSWELVEAPATWSVLMDGELRGLAEATILDGADSLIAVSVHGSREWGLVEPTTEIWVSD